jgi:hypothetical protein
MYMQHVPHCRQVNTIRIPQYVYLFYMKNLAYRSGFFRDPDSVMVINRHENPDVIMNISFSFENYHFNDNIRNGGFHGRSRTTK